MDFVDKVAEGARDIAGNVVKTTGELVEKGKKSLELSRLKGERREALVALGEIAYGLAKGYGGEGAKEGLVEQLDEIVQKINDIEAMREAERQQREEQRDAERAEREAERARRSAERQANAGGPIEIKMDHEQCKDCGQDRIGSLQYCGYCGARYEETKEEPVKDEEKKD